MDKRELLALRDEHLTEQAAAGQQPGLSLMQVGTRAGGWAAAVPAMC
jgi:hypothetical protein